MQEHFDGPQELYEFSANALSYEWKGVLMAMFLNRRALASIIPGREKSEETTICYKISLVQLINNLNVILYLSSCHTVYISVLILFMIMSQLIINS